MPIDQLIFIGLNGYVLALHRDSGEIVWSNDEMKKGYVTLILDGDRLMVSSNGYIYCLEPTTGKIRWHNPLKGYGQGTPTSLVSTRSQVSQAAVLQMAASIQAQQAAAAAAGASH